MAAFPHVQAKIRDAVEAEGLSPEEVMKRLHEQAELELLGDEAPDEDRIPNHIYIIAQALAYRSATPDDSEELFALLSDAYHDEVEGKDAFRRGPPIRREEVEAHLSDPDLTWMVAEAPNGHGHERDGVILGCACYSTNGVSRRNGKEEGRLCSIRFFAVKRIYQGLCIGRRLLAKLESTVFADNCCRMMACLPSTRRLTEQWVGRRGFVQVASMPYPFRGLQHEPLEAMESTKLLQFVLINPTHSLGRPVKASSSAATSTTSAIADSKGPPSPTSTPLEHQVFSRLQISEDFVDELGVD